MGMHGLPQGITNPPRPLAEVEAELDETRPEDMEERTKTTGTVILVFIFLAAFILYYFTNWKLLSLVWRIG